MMRRWKRWCVIGLSASLAVCGCTGRTAETGTTENETKQETAAAVTEKMEEEASMETAAMRGYQEVRQYMMDSYELSGEELDGLDILRFAEDYQIYERTYTPEEMKELLEDVKTYYVDDGTTALFSMFDRPEEGGLKDGVQISRIGYYRNEGTLLERVVYDLEEGEAYVDSAEPLALAEEQVSMLKQMPFACGIPAWESRCEGEEEKSTGSFRWKMVFECADGDVCVYGGYTGDGSHLPENFAEADEALMTVADQLR